MAVRRRLDFLVLCETKLRDAKLVRAMAESAAPGMRIRILSSCRPDPDGPNNERKTPASGGILVLALNPSLTLIDSWDDNKGILSFSARLPGAAPFACVCVYYPDSASPYSRWTDDLIEASGREVARRRDLYGNLVFWLGDFNIRVGQFECGLESRSSPDVKSALTPRAKKLRRLMRRLGVLPIHGRAPHLPAQFTSAQVAGLPGRAEVDYIVAPASLSPSKCRLIAAPSWGSMELPTSGTHLPLFIEVALPSAPAAYAALPTRNRPKRPFVLPPYCDSRWFAIHRRIESNLPNTLRVFNDPSMTLEACHASLVSLFRSAAVAECGTGLPRVRSFKQRLYQGVPLPTELVAIFDLARYYRKQRKLARGQRARTFYEVRADNVKRTAQALARSFLKRFRDTLLSNLERQMRIDPHQAHGFLAHLHGVESSNCADPSTIPPGPDGHPPLLRFGLACERLVTQLSACPSAATSQYWLNQIAQAGAGAELVRPFSPRQIYEYFFPATKRHPTPCHRDCRICQQYLAEVQRWRPRDPFPTMPVPHHRGSLHTSRGADINNLVTELIRWVRPEDWHDKWDYRMAVCRLLARFFNDMLTTRSVPAGAFAQCVTSPLFKAVKPGVRPPPRWDDDAYRFITNSSLLAKAFSTLLASRLAHWAVRSGLISEQQVAFLPFRGTEEHVFTLQQVLRERARRKQQTFLLFVDFKKAYDSVHLDALWVVLKKQGVPEQFIELLRDWAAKRRTQVRVNGELSEPFNMSKGVPQGDPLSCLLFNLFIDSLSRFLRSRPDLPGVTAFGGGVNLQHQFYADDLVGLACSAAELQRLLAYVKQWADAWGMEINTSVGKTEAMLVDADASHVHPPHLVLDDGRAVQWTYTYRYLGYMLRSDLRDTDATAGMLDYLKYLWSAHFKRNGVVRHASAAFQTQYYCTMVQGSLRNLRALTTLYSADIAALEVLLRRHITEIFNVRSSTPIDLVSALGAMLPWRAVCAQEHERLYLQLSNSLYPESVAVRVFRLAQADPTIGASFAKQNWVRAWERDRAAYAALGVPLAAPGTHYELLPSAAKTFGRAVAFVEWQSSGRASIPAPIPCNASAAPPHRPTEAIAQLFENFAAPISSLGEHHQFTPFSAQGPGCSGSMPARSSLKASRLGPLAWARTGAAVMSSALFLLEGNVADYAAHARPCALCGVTPVDLFHFATECNHPRISAWRDSLEESARGLIVTLTRVIGTQRESAGYNASGHSFLLRRVRRAVEGVQFDSREGDFIIYRLLVAQPWPERLADPGMRTVRLLGRVFDLPGMYHRFERPIADAWCRWSLYWLWSLSRVWRDANVAHGGAV